MVIYLHSVGIPISFFYEDNLFFKSADNMKADNITQHAKLR